MDCSHGSKSCLHMEQIEQKRKPRKWPNCGHMPEGKIFYEYPSPDFWESKKEKFTSGEIIIGGCCLRFDDPTWECFKCHQQIWKPIPEEELIGGECK